MARHIEMVPHDLGWAKQYKREAREILAVFGEQVTAIHHIGSTAIPGIKAKPIIDLLAEANDISKVDGYNDGMMRLGYEPKGENGITGRRYFRKLAGEKHTHHVHVFQKGDPQITRHLDFRDYLIAFPKSAKAYSCLKERLAEEFPHDSEAYTNGKDAFVRDIERKAAIWRERRWHG